MTNTIIGRERQLKILDNLMASNSAEFLVVYGRRRVGKTYLIHEYLKADTVFSFSGSFQESTQSQIGNFFREYLRLTKGQSETVLPRDWNTALSYLTDYLYSLKKESSRKVVVFIDEMPWLDTPKSGFVPALEYFWNQHASKMNNLLLIACGSAASWIQKKLLKSKGGFYNRVTRRIKLEPFNLHETELFCKRRRLKLSRYQIIQIYMAMGGIPYYLNALNPGKSAIQLIDEICFSPNSLLSDEYGKLYYSLFKNAENYTAIIEALAKHPYGLLRNTLVHRSGLPDGGTFARTLEDLVESGFVAKFRPFQKKQKDSIYRLIDLYSLFYLRFIKGNIDGNLNTWQAISGDHRFSIWSGYAYENICMLHIRQILFKLGISGTFTQISSWYHKGTHEVPGAQIDLLVDRRDGVINLCEAKFSNKEFTITKDYVAKLRQKRAVFEEVTKTKKSVVTTLITTYPARRNAYYLEEINSEATMDDLFEEIRNNFA